MKRKAKKAKEGKRRQKKAKEGKGRQRRKAKLGKYILCLHNIRMVRFNKIILLFLFFALLVSFFVYAQTLKYYLENSVGRMFILFMLISITEDFPLFGILGTLALFYLYYSKGYSFLSFTDSQSPIEPDDPFQTLENHYVYHQEKILSADESLKPKASQTLLSKINELSTYKEPAPHFKI